MTKLYIVSYFARMSAVPPSELSIFFPDYDDDIAILQISAPLLLNPQEIAVLGTAEDSEGNPFRSYGFRCLGPSSSGYADGDIMGPVLPFAGKNLLAEPIELRTRDIRPGMSGSGVLHMKRNLVVGLVTQRWNPGSTSVNDNIACLGGRYLRPEL